MADALDKAIEYLTESHLDSFGGYPHDFRQIGDVVVVADLDDAKDRNRTLLRVFSRDALVAWARRAAQYMSDNRDAEWSEAFGETHDETDEIHGDKPC